MISEMEHSLDSQSVPLARFGFDVQICGSGTAVTGTEVGRYLQGERPFSMCTLPLGSESVQENLMGEKDIDEFLETVYLLNYVSETRKAIDVVFDRFNELLEHGNYGACNTILTRVDVNRISSTLMVAFLSITLPAKKIGLWARPAFFARAYASLVVSRGEDKTKRLLLKYL